MKTNLTIAAFFLLQASLLQAQDANLEETLSWIKGKIESQKPLWNDPEEKMVIGYFRFEYEGCEVKYMYEQHFSGGYTTNSQKVNLKNIQEVRFYSKDSTEYYKDISSVRMMTLWEQKLVKVWDTGDKTPSAANDEKEARLRNWFDIGSKEAGRLQKAFDHAMKLCGGGTKKEKF